MVEFLRLFDNWLGDNALGEIRVESSQFARLLYDGNVMCFIGSSMNEMPSPIGLSNGDEFQYKRRVSVKVSPADGVLPISLQEALAGRGFTKE